MPFIIIPLILAVVVGLSTGFIRFNLFGGNEHQNIVEQTEPSKALIESTKAGEGKGEEQQKEKDLSDIIAEWEPFVFNVFCVWRYKDTNKTYARGEASGTIVYEGLGSVSFLTNRHVVMKDDKYVPSGCVLFKETKPGQIGAVIDVNNPKILTHNTNEALDVAFIDIGNKTNDELMSLGMRSTAKLSNRCDKVSLGERIVVLGYPKIGTEYAITVTEGIISGEEEDYYVTSAKIEYGNSGGIAISAKQNCFLGIPTEATIGDVESLGKILKAKVIFNR